MENLNKDFTLVGSKGSDSTEKIAKPALSFFQDAWRRFKKNKVALVAMWIIAITLVFSVISAFVVPQSKANYFDPNKSQVYGNLPPKLSGDLPSFQKTFFRNLVSCIIAAIFIIILLTDVLSVIFA